MCEDTAFVTGVGNRHRFIPLQPLVEALCPERTAGLPGFHAMSGADNSDSGLQEKESKPVGKRSWKQVQKLSLLCSENPTEATEAALEHFSCQLHLPNTSIIKVKDARWWLFRKKQAQSDRLPPTKATLHEALMRAHYQAMVWNNDKVVNPELSSPQDYGWMMEDNEWLPVVTRLAPAQEAVIHFVKCGCVKQRCETNHCQCRKAGLNCIGLCSYSDNGKKFDNEEHMALVEENDNEDESDVDDDDDNDTF